MEGILLVGIQGSGKSTFYKERFFDTHVRINLDMLRTRRREGMLIEACLRAKQRFVVDNTNVQRESRAKYLRLCAAAGFRTVGYFFDPNVERAIAWNASREGKAAVPIQGLLGTLKKLERPEMGEGFDELFTVTIDRAGRYRVKPSEIGGAR